MLTRVTPAAAGGAWPYANHPAQGAPETGSQGGNLGGQAVGTIAVSPDGPIRPGDVLYIEVGQVGQPANDGTDNYDCSWAIPGFLTCGPVAGPASFNGGGAGGGENDAGTIGGGGSGGGASDVRLCPRSNLCTTGHVSSLASRLIVAGGAGGGFAGQYLPDGRMAAGGAGPGGSGGSPPGGGSGKGGSLTSGGVGGYRGIDAGNGALGQGGDGVGGGRGGGGGYYGGGGGDGSYHAFAAGGGGSNYIPPGGGTETFNGHAQNFAEPHVDVTAYGVAPTIQVHPPTNITATSAWLWASANPQGEDAYWRYQVVSDADYKANPANPWAAARISPEPPGYWKVALNPPYPTTPQILGAMVGCLTCGWGTNFDKPLEPDTTYHYRAVITNLVNPTVVSDEGTFTTPPAAPPAPAPVCQDSTQPAIAHGASHTMRLDLLCDDRDYPVEFSYRIVDQPAHGTISRELGDSSARITYTPDAGYSGPDSFAYTASNQGTPSDVKTVTLTVRPPAPSCADQSGLRTPEGRDLGVTLSCTSAAGFPVTSYAFSGPAHGTLVNLNTGTGAVTYRPNVGYSGPDSFTYTATNDGGTSTSRTVSITVDPKPSCPDLSITTAFEESPTLALPCTDATGQQLTSAVIDGPSHGELTSFDPDTGNLTYAPAANWSGPDVFTYTAMSSNGTSATARVDFTVNPRRPACQNVGGKTTGRGLALQVALQCSTNPGGSLKYEIVEGPQHGALSVLDETSGTVRYTPTGSFTGNDEFTYTATNGGGTAETATVSIVVNPPPVCEAKSGSTAYGASTQVALACADPAAPGVTYALADPPQHGSLSGFDANAGELTYTPDVGFHGSDSFTYTAMSANGESDAAEVTVDVGLPPAPTCEDVGPLSTPKAEALSVALDCEAVAGADPVMAIVEGPEHGSLSGLGGTSVTYTPAAGYFGPDSFTYKASNAGGDSLTRTVSITVTQPVETIDVTLDPASIVADGASRSLVIVRLRDRDRDGVGVAGEASRVTLTAPSGNPLGALEDKGGGRYEASVTSTLTPGDVEIRAAHGSKKAMTTLAQTALPGPAPEQPSGGGAGSGGGGSQPATPVAPQSPATPAKPKPYAKCNKLSGKKRKACVAKVKRKLALAKCKKLKGAKRKACVTRANRVK